MGSKAGLDAVTKRKIFAPSENQTPDFHPVAQSLYRQELPRLLLITSAGQITVFLLASL